VSFLVYA